jgi:GNAT superfamily N-acetyltransferase
MNCLNPDLAFAWLAARPQAIPRVARWWCDEWGLPGRHGSFDDYVRELEGLRPDALPIHLLAEHAGTAVGVATLKVKPEHPMAPPQAHWLSGVYVEPSSRGRGVATSLCFEILALAGRRSVGEVYLQTTRLDGGLYAKLGWTPVVRHTEAMVEQLVMVKALP